MTTAPVTELMSPSNTRSPSSTAPSPKLNHSSTWELTSLIPPTPVASQSDVVFSIVGYPSDVRHVILHPASGVLSGLRPGGIIVDMTTSEPSLACEISAAASSKNCSAIDAPVSGGDRGAKNGTLAIFAGGDESVINKVNPLFCPLGEKGMIYAHKAGLNVELFLNAISTGAAGSKLLDCTECQSMGLALPGLALAQQLYLSLKAHGEGNLGTQALILSLERLNNVSLQSVASSEPSA
ncbi:hypothetical protein Pint_13279 [Pistacia integerrima]|uniref:Uncharacterized protein n=1 Tax=Pistacia integerrima TaxID=434235 RepID=A0ACC0Y6P8_9ROSI|nr:hypothetical protein Pint_13279 [Pistacia integerrima]